MHEVKGKRHRIHIMHWQIITKGEIESGSKVPPIQKLFSRKIASRLFSRDFLNLIYNVSILDMAIASTTTMAFTTRENKNVIHWKWGKNAQEIDASYSTFWLWLFRWLEIHRIENVVRKIDWSVAFNVQSFWKTLYQDVAHFLRLAYFFLQNRSLIDVFSFAESFNFRFRDSNCRIDSIRMLVAHMHENMYRISCSQLCHCGVLRFKVTFTLRPKNMGIFATDFQMNEKNALHYFQLSASDGENHPLNSLVFDRMYNVGEFQGRK